MMKNFAKRLLIGLVLMSVLGLVVPPPAVEAAEPECFFYGTLTGGVEGASSITCNEGFLAEYEALSPGFGGFEDDKCYILRDLPEPSAREIGCDEVQNLVDGTEDTTVFEPDPEFESGAVVSGACGGGEEELEQEDALRCLFERAGEAVFFLSLLIGVALTGSTIFAGIQYTTAGADASKVEKAKGRLASNIIVLVGYLFSASILNWILPG